MMIEYLYFVKFENDTPFDNPFDWEEDVFNTFNEALAFAKSNMSSHPEIHQTEIVRNDFGECVDSKNIGLVWSWQDELSDIPEDDSEVTVFNKGDFDEYADGYNPDTDHEFSDDDITFETDCVAKDFLTETYYAVIEVDGKERRFPFNTREEAKSYLNDVRAGKDPSFKGKQLGSMYTESCSRKTVPEDMSIRDIVEAMEENEAEVECAWCNELFNKEDCTHTEHNGWLCDSCADDIVECTWCEELYDKSDCRYEVNLGWLCSSCQAAIKSRGESLTFKENDYWDFLDESAVTKTDESISESYNPIETVDLDYEKLTIEISGPKRDVDDWDEVEYSDSYTYCVKKGDVATALWEDFLTDEDVASVQGGFDALEDDKAWVEFLNIHFDELFEKYYNQLLEYFKDDATEAFENEFTWDEYVASKANWNESCSPKSMLEELEDADEYNKRLTMCPECGETSYDAETGFCISCGFN